jgi:hypothetical protein
VYEVITVSENKWICNTICTGYTWRLLTHTRREHGS